MSFVANFGQQVGAQVNSRVVALPDGDFVVAWTNFGASQATTVWMQRFESNGAPVGGPVQAFTTASQTVLSDIAVASDGRIWLAGVEGTSVVLRSFSQLTMAPTTAQITLSPASAPFGVQIDANPAVAGGISVIVTTQGLTAADTNYNIANVSATGIAGPLGLLTGLNGAPNQSVIEFQAEGLTISSSGSAHLAILGSGAPLTLPSTGRPTDVVQVRPDLYVVSIQSNTSNDVRLQAVIVTPFGGLALGGTVVAGFGGSGTTTAGVNVYDAELLRLDNDRVLVIFVSDGGDTSPGGGITPAVDGVYAAVYNLATGAVGESILLRSLGTIGNEVALQAVELSATVLADGQVAVTYSANAGGNTFWGEDVFVDLLDLRIAGVTVTGTINADRFQGSAFNDTFSNVSNDDVINGSAGEDTVVFSGATPRVVDLANPSAVPETTFVLTSIENLTGGTGADVFYGTSGANKLLGGAGNDTLSGRSGADLLAGGTGTDVLFGAAGADTLNGDADNDSLYGGLDADLALGGTGNDLISGGAGDDELFGNDGDDRLFGDAGNDQIDGGAGGDYLDGGAGDDWVQGGLGNDTLRSETGADSLMGGEGNDVFIATADVGLVDGGNGIDTLIVSAPVSDPLESGLYVDLSGGTVSFSNLATMEEFTGLISGIENVTGSVGSDFLIGSSGANALRGGSGNDTLVGLGGDDTLVGGAGADIFIFLSPTHGNDRITGFETGADTLALLADAFGDLGSADLASRLTINATATVAANANAQLIFDNNGAGAGRLFFDADGNGAGVAVLIATLTMSTPAGLTTFSASDFVFI